LIPLNEKFWLQPTDEVDTFGLGFTEEYLSTLGPIWALIPRHNVVALVKDAIFANIESSRCLGALRAPCNGTIIEWNGEAIDCPDTITPATEILTLRGIK
jgi:glycine cleavage system H lipoate-binding protein